MAAIDPSAEAIHGDGEHKTPRATLKIITLAEDDDEDDEDWEDDDDVDELRARLREAGVLGSDDDDSEISEGDESEEETNGGPSDPAKSKKAKREALEKKLKEDLAAEEMELDSMTNGANGKSKGKAKAVNGDISEDDDSEDDDSEEGIEVDEELVLCTLDPEKVSMSL